MHDIPYFLLQFMCPKRQVVIDDRKYEVHMLYTNYHTEVNLCNLRIRDSKCRGGSRIAKAEERQPNTKDLAQFSQKLHEIDKNISWE